MNQFSTLIEDYIRKKQETKGSKFCVPTWLDSAAKRASQISVATHVLKYTHGDAKGTNIHLSVHNISETSHSHYISTNSLTNIRKDFSGNASALDIAGLLELESNGITLLELLQNGDHTPFHSFTQCDSQLSTWLSGFKCVLLNKNPSSHELAKQVYFPVENDHYHLLAPLYASSLNHKLYERITEDLFGEFAKEAREKRKKNEFSEKIIVDYPDLAVQKFGGTKPQNISRLNSSRYGKSYLLRSTPPVWKSIKKPPMKTNSFWLIFNRRSFTLMKEFKEFLTFVQKKESNKEIRDKRKSFVDQLLELFIQTSSEIQMLESDWSSKSEIPLHEKLWLDPYNSCLDFQKNRLNESWQESVSKKFSNNLIKYIENEKMKFSDNEFHELSNECLKCLKAIEL